MEETDPNDPSAAPSASPAEEASEVVLECASSGRAKCRGCGDKIAKGELRFGEKLPSPFTDKPTSYWFHVHCAVLRRPEPLGRALNGTAEPPPETQTLMALVQQGTAHPRLARIATAEFAPSGRAKCRQCRELIEKGSLRIVLEIWEEGRFAPIGFIHPSCAEAYFGTTPSAEHVDFACRNLAEQDRAQARALLLASNSTDR